MQELFPPPADDELRDDDDGRKLFGIAQIALVQILKQWPLMARYGDSITSSGTEFRFHFRHLARRMSICCGSHAMASARTLSLICIAYSSACSEERLRLFISTTSGV